MNKILVIVEASGKVEILRKRLKAIGISAEVMATMGHVADNPQSLSPILLSETLNEMAYTYKAEKQGLLEKISRAALHSDLIYLAMDDDDEGDVIAYDVAKYLSGQESKMFRVRLRAISEDELKTAFLGDHSQDFKLSANNGICRRIVDRAIGATFTKFAEINTISIGRVQSSLLACIDDELPQMGEYVIQLVLDDSKNYIAVLPVYNQFDIDKYDVLSHSLDAGLFNILSTELIEVAASTPWGFEEIVVEVSIKLHVTVTQAAEVLQDAYIKGRVSYPRVRANGFTKDAVEVALSISKQNRCGFNAASLAGRQVDGGDAPHESPRPLDRYMMLGRPMNVLDMGEAVAVLVARNTVECGQLVKHRKIQVQVNDMQIEMTHIDYSPVKNWKNTPKSIGFKRFEKDCALLMYMAKKNLGRPSTIIAHVDKFLKRGVLKDDGESLGLNKEGVRWLTQARSIGFSEKTSNQMERAFSVEITDPARVAREILEQHGMLQPVLQITRERKSIDKTEKNNDMSI